nr:hypothetical protein CFP56_56619 [Quercus suber]
MATCGLLKPIIALETSCESHSKCASQMPTSQAKSSASSSAFTLASNDPSVQEDEEQGRGGDGGPRGSGFDNNGDGIGVYGKKTGRWRWWHWQGQSSTRKDGGGFSCLWWWS